jgi:hypothetical protein
LGAGFLGYFDMYAAKSFNIALATKDIDTAIQEKAPEVLTDLSIMLRFYRQDFKTPMIGEIAFNQTIGDGPSNPNFRVLNSNGAPCVRLTDIATVTAWTEEFDAMHVFTTAHLVNTMWEETLNSIENSLPKNHAAMIKARKRWDSKGTLDIYPHANKVNAERTLPNAMYIPSSTAINSDRKGNSSRRELQFFDFWGKKSNKMISSAQSADIVAHEFGHFILDVLAPNLDFDIGSSAFHEAFADITALMHAMNQDALLEKFLTDNGGDFHSTNFISSFAEQYGEETNEGDKGLRNADDDVKMSDLTADTADEPHAVSRVFTGAFYDAFVDIIKKTNKGGITIESIKDVASSMRFAILHSVITGPENKLTFQGLVDRMKTAFIISPAKGNAKIFEDSLTNIFAQRLKPTIQQQPTTPQQPIISQQQGWYPQPIISQQGWYPQPIISQQQGWYPQPIISQQGWYPQPIISQQGWYPQPIISQQQNPWRGFRFSKVIKSEEAIDMAISVNGEIVPTTSFYVPLSAGYSALPGMALVGSLLLKKLIFNSSKYHTW